ncbi:hypothetical protein K458DRAFT_411110 [Lentithecium fluviatile CBS 122367]|uniref:BTB domain-containing protein n=1 Tax=Lentithecium fluviatile CBS 122367 TaxID=1168545 RepID=A0A6G1IC35_9PLEO|nr:hypothetical protein K458DRAFT_411110 [Lentithecium fluviatile CBS 122367]
MGWHDRIVYFRDFAYTSRRARMASGNIGDVPAATYAEYVRTSFPELPGHPPDGASDSSSDEESHSSESSDAPRDDGPPYPPSAASRCLPVRPVLAHRLNSHRLHVRAKAKLQRDRLLSGPMLDVYVGASKRHWALHRNLLCHHSELLEAELHGNGQKQDKLELPDHDPTGFELLVKWLYQGKLDDVSDMADANQKYDYAVSCHKLYLLCDRFDMPQLKNVAMDQYRKGLNQAELVPDADEIDEIYRQSPVGSPFRRLMTRIAARQIMDPGSERDVETYRQCFESNSDFAIEMVKAIKHGTGGMLFDDPTETGNECEYHDHDAGPNCHIKGKGKAKQALKASALPRDPRFDRSALSKSSDLPPRPHRPSHPPQDPPPPPRQARRQDGASSVGPLRRRLTSPASSTVETSIEHATASPPSPKEQRDKFRRATPPEKHQQSPALPEASTEESHPAPADPHPSSSVESRPPQDSATSDTRATPPSKAENEESKEDQTSPSRGIWGWAKSGTGRLGIIGRIPHPEWKGPILTAKAATSAVNGVLEGGKTVESLDDFSIPASTSTEPDNVAQQEEAAAAKIEGLGIANSTVDPMFSQTKRSSDELAASVTTTPSPNALNDEQWTNRIDSMMISSADSLPATPSPAQRKKEVTSGSESTPSPQRIPKYKIALAANILAPHRTVST